MVCITVDPLISSWSWEKGLNVSGIANESLMKFYGFVETDQMLTAGFNGYSKSQWSENQKRTKNNAGSRTDLKTKDLTPEEVRSVRDKLEPLSFLFPVNPVVLHLEARST